MLSILRVKWFTLDHFNVLGSHVVAFSLHVPNKAAQLTTAVALNQDILLQYSFSLTTFSPSGKLVQIEYALNAVNGGSTSLGIKATNGVVIATEKKLRSTLIDESTVQKISLLTPNIGVAYSGMGPDSRLLVRKARKSAQVQVTLQSYRRNSSRP